MKYYIIEDDPQADFDSFIPLDSSIEKMEMEYLSNLRIKGPKHLIINFYSDGDHLSKIALEFLQSNDKRFEIGNSSGIFHFLKLLNREESLTWNMIKDLAGFSFADKSLGWDQKKFDNIINDCKKDPYFKNIRTELEGYLKKLTINHLFDY